MIQFYSSKERPYGVFSNFSPHHVIIDEVPLPTTEHYFQAMKFSDPELQQRVWRASTPMDAANIGRDRSLARRPDWAGIRDYVMFKAVIHKFTQHPDLRAILLGTGAEVLVEHTANDHYWADGGDGTGRNMLGTLLMVVRGMLQEFDEERK